MKLIKLVMVICTLLFVDLSAATISGYAYCDLSSDGIKDDNESCTQEEVYAKIINEGNGHVTVSKALYDEDPAKSGYFEFSTGKKIGTFRVFIDNNAVSGDIVATPPANFSFTSDPDTGGYDPANADGQTTYNITDANELHENQNFGMQFGGECNCTGADGEIIKRTMLIDGNISEWQYVYIDPDNNICDYGCALDKDAKVASTGRNLVAFTWTGDDLFAYGYTYRVGSNKNTDKFLYYTDRDGDGLMETGDFALVVEWQGNTGSADFYKYDYTQTSDLGSSSDTDGDPMVWQPGDEGTVTPNGQTVTSDWIYSGDGYTIAGRLDNKTAIPSTEGHAEGVTPETGGDDDAGVKMEWRIKWDYIGLTPFQGITYHVSSTNTQIGSTHPPLGIDDNMAGCFGEATLKLCGVTLVPDHSVTLPAGSTGPVYFEHNLTNTGTGDDNLTLTITPISGDFTPTSITLYNDTNDNGVEDSGEEMINPVAIALGESINLLVKVELPAGLDNNTTVFEINATTTTCDINHSAVVTDTINISTRNYDLAVLKEVSADGTNWFDGNVEVNEGEAASYRITVHNYGPDEAINVVVGDYLPVAGVTYVSHTAPSGTDYNNTTGLWTIGTLPSGEERELIIDVTADLEAGLIAPGKVYQNIACTSDTNITVGEYPDCDDANITIIHKPIVDLQITKKVSNHIPYEGDDINYTITVTNFGPDDAINVVVNDTLPSHVTPAGDLEHNATKGSVSGTVWTIGNMLEGEVQVLTFYINVDSNATANNPQTNTVHVTTDTNDTDPSNDYASSTFRATNTVDVSVMKTVDTLYPGEGDTIVYTIEVTNHGPINVTNLVVQEEPITWATVTETNTTLGIYTAPDWNIPELNVSQTATLTITATVNDGTAGGDPYINIARIDSLDQNDTNGTNDRDTATIIVENPSITIEKFTNDINVTAAPGPNIYTGTVVTWDYNVTNTGDVNLTNITVTDINSTGGSVTVTCPTTPTILIPGASILCTASDTAINGQYDNNATVTGTSPAGHDVNDSDMSWYFGTYAPASIGDFAWYDDNNNGVQDTGEVPVNGLTVALLDASGNIMATTTTDSAGYYSFDNLASGTYSVRFSGLTSEYVFSTKQHDSVANSDGSTDPIILAGIDIDTIDVGLFCITTKDGDSKGGGCTYNPNSKSFDMMYILMLLSILFFGRRELKRNER